MSLMFAPLDWQYAELPSSASDAVLCSVLVGHLTKLKKTKRKPRLHKNEYYRSIKCKLLVTSTAENNIYSYCRSVHQIFISEKHHKVPI